MAPLGRCTSLKTPPPCHLDVRHALIAPCRPSCCASIRLPASLRTVPYGAAATLCRCSSAWPSASWASRGGRASCPTTPARYWWVGGRVGGRVESCGAGRQAGGLERVSVLACRRAPPLSACLWQRRSKHYVAPCWERERRRFTSRCRPCGSAVLHPPLTCHPLCRCAVCRLFRRACSACCRWCSRGKPSHSTTSTAGAYVAGPGRHGAPLYPLAAVGPAGGPLLSLPLGVGAAWVLPACLGVMRDAVAAPVAAEGPAVPSRRAPSH